MGSWVGSSVFKASSNSVRRAANESFAPMDAHSFASALPIPDDAPVITTTLSFTVRKIGFFTSAKLI
jgi:hypothetical protein